jgi:hypothetical protein
MIEFKDERGAVWLRINLLFPWRGPRSFVMIGWRCHYFPPLPRSWWDDEIDYMNEIGW